MKRRIKNLSDDIASFPSSLSQLPALSTIKQLLMAPFFIIKSNSSLIQFDSLLSEPTPLWQQPFLCLVLCGAGEGTTSWATDAASWAISFIPSASPISEDSHTAEMPSDDFVWTDPIGTSIHEGPIQSGSASQVPATDDVPSSDDRLPDYKVAGSSSCEPLNRSPTPSAVGHIHEGPNQSSPASEMYPTSNAATGDDGLLDFKVNTSLDWISKDPILSATDTVDIHEGPNPSTPASLVPSTEKQVNGDDPLPNLKIWQGTDSASSQPLDLSSDTLTNDPSPTASNTQPIHDSLPSQMPPISNEAKSDDQLLGFKNLQFVGNLGDTLCDRDLNYTASSSCKDHPSLNFLSSDIGTTTVDTCEPLDLSKSDPTDNEVNGPPARL